MKPENIELKVGVKTFIVDKVGRVLVLKRSKSKYGKIGDEWDIPGGRINAGNGLETNLRREVLEETGIKTFKLISLVSAQDILKEAKHVVRLTYISRVTSNKVILSEEHTEYRWVDLKDLYKTKNLDKLVHKLLKDRKTMSFMRSLVK